VVVLVGVTPHRGARESRVQGEAPESGGRRSRATNRMRIWGNAPGEAGERRTDRSRVLGSMGAENWVKAQQHTAQEVAAVSMQKLSHKFRLLQGTFANEHVPISP
jgi:hypothetical protein